ncbi:MAG TPA: J domain-containing protein [Candidatus Obscuribacterales bacterium]
MARKANHYQILGIASDVTPAEIKRAYRKLAKTQHPDAQAPVGTDEHSAATEEMMRINEAYETLMDAGKRADYDHRIGLGRIKGKQTIYTAFDEDAQRDKFMRKIFIPCRSAIVRVLGQYKKELHDLSADPYDDGLMERFQQYVDEIEDALRHASETFTRNPAPRSLHPAVQLMRYSIAQAADGMEELRYFCKNYDYSHLTMAENLFRISSDLSRQALGLTKA